MAEAGTGYDTLPREKFIRPFRLIAVTVFLLSSYNSRSTDMEQP